MLKKLVWWCGPVVLLLLVLLVADAEARCRRFGGGGLFRGRCARVRACRPRFFPIRRCGFRRSSSCGSSFSSSSGSCTSGSCQVTLPRATNVIELESTAPGEIDIVVPPPAEATPAVPPGVRPEINEGVRRAPKAGRQFRLTNMTIVRVRG